MNGTISGYKLTRQMTASLVKQRSGSGVVMAGQGEVLVSAVTSAGETVTQPTPTQTGTDSQATTHSYYTYSDIAQASTAGSQEAP